MKIYVLHSDPPIKDYIYFDISGNGHVSLNKLNIQFKSINGRGFYLSLLIWYFPKLII